MSGRNSTSPHAFPCCTSSSISGGANWRARCIRCALLPPGWSSRRHSARRVRISDSIEPEARTAREPVAARACGLPASAGGRLAVRLADDVGDAFRTDVRGVQASRRQFAVLAGLEGLRLVVPGHGDLAAEHHDPRIEIVRMRFLGHATLLAAMHHLEALAAQVALERLAGQWAVAPATG